MADGFPILYKFGPNEVGVIKILKPSYKLKAGERPGDGISVPVDCTQENTLMIMSMIL